MKNIPQPVFLPIPIKLPEELGDITINELINYEDTEFIKRGNKLFIRTTTDFGTATIEFETFKTDRQEKSETIVPARSIKADYVDDMKNMWDIGRKQKDIAFELGMSEAYVSQLIKKNNL